MKLDIPAVYNQICIKEGDKWNIVFQNRYKYFKILIYVF